VHTVWLEAYWIDQTEVSNWQYGLCLDAGACNPPQKTSSVTRSNYFYSNTYQDYPVVWVTWDDAHDYCDWVGGYLPTEAEWEKAARGPNGYKYPWGNSSPTSNLANFGNNLGDTNKVGSYMAGASPYGVLDMAGNAYEWIYDYYSADYYSSSPSDNPFGPDSGDMQVLKSASFNTSAYLIRSANRGRYAPDTTGDDDGFRCIRYSID
jgi:formylglycine-generating enzyme required for sulfatase activity